jgi:hypothetical protein
MILLISATLLGLITLAILCFWPVTISKSSWSRQSSRKGCSAISANKPGEYVAAVVRTVVRPASGPTSRGRQSISDSLSNHSTSRSASTYRTPCGSRRARKTVGSTEELQPAKSPDCPKLAHLISASKPQRNVVPLHMARVGKATPTLALRLLIQRAVKRI